MKKNLFRFILISCSVFLVACNGNEPSTKEKSIEKVEEKAPEPEVVIPDPVVHLYAKNGENLVGDPCESHVLVYLHADTIRFISNDCEDEYSIFKYYNGLLKDLSSTVEYQKFDNCGGSDPSQTMCLNKQNTTIKLSADSTNITIDKVTFKKVSKSSKNTYSVIGTLEKKGQNWGVNMKKKSTDPFKYVSGLEFVGL